MQLIIILWSAQWFHNETLKKNVFTFLCFLSKKKIVMLKLTYFTYFRMFALVKLISQDFYNLHIFPYNQTIVVLRRFVTMFILEGYKAFD